MTAGHGGRLPTGLRLAEGTGAHIPKPGSPARSRYALQITETSNWAGLLTRDKLSLTDCKRQAACRSAGPGRSVHVGCGQVFRGRSGDDAMRGRAREWRTVLGFLHRAEEGFGGVLLIEGDHGTAKSLLLEETANAAAARGFTAVTAAADEHGLLMPLASLLTAVTALTVPSEAYKVGLPHPDITDMKTWLVDRLGARLRAEAGTGQVLVGADDLQWGDPLTLRALRALPRDLASCPVLWTLTRRTGVPGDEAERLFGQLEADGATRIWLPPLGDEEVTELVTEALGSVPSAGLLSLAAGASGNPFLLSELVAGLRDEDAVLVRGGHATLVSDQLPGRIRSAVKRRLASLSRQAWQLLQTASLLGPSFELDDAAEMLGESPATLLLPLQEALDAGVLVASEDTVMFRHELERQSVAETIPAPVRRALHRQFGEILAERGGCAVSAAAHLLEGARSGDIRALAGLDRAGQEILAYAPETAADIAVRALELTPLADADRCGRAVAAIESLAFAGRLAEAADIAHAALAAPPPGTGRSRVRCALCAVLYLSGQVTQAAAEAEQVLTEPRLPDSVRDTAQIALLHALAELPDGRKGSDCAEAILAAPQLHDSDLVVAALVAGAAIRWDAGRIADSLALCREAVRRTDGASPRSYRPVAYLVLAEMLMKLGSPDEAVTVLEAAAGQPGIAGQIAWAARIGILRARLHLAAGRLDEAAAQAEAAQHAAEALGAHLHASLALSVLGLIALRRGRLQSAEQHLRTGQAYLRDEERAARHPRQVVLAAQIEEALAGPQAAAAMLAGVYAELPRQRWLLLADPAAAPWLTRVALAAGDRRSAERVADVAAGFSRDNPPFPALAAAAAHARGILQCDPAGVLQAAQQHADPWARASADEDLGVQFLLLGDDHRAVAQLDQALGGYQHVGALRDSARIRHRLRGLGVRRRHWACRDRPVTGWASLTDTERQTSELVSQGLTNQQVADQMFVSVHTVAFHLRQVFRKLGIRSRVELTRLAVEQDPRPPGGDPGRTASPRQPTAGQRPGASRMRGWPPVNWLDRADDVRNR